MKRLPEKIRSEFKRERLEKFRKRYDTIYMGFTTIDLLENSKECHIMITHAGNMGNSLEQVEKNVDLALGKGVYKKLRELGKVLEESGSPDYFYELVLGFRREYK